MRQRKLVDLDERMDRLAEFIDLDAKKNKGAWRVVLGERAGGLYLELGCGKGKFICDMADAFPEDMFIGIEGNQSVLVRAAEKLQAEGRANVHLASAYVDDIRDFFETGELSGIYLNFSDPWPKARHAKRRLTYRDNLEAYMDVLCPGGFLEFKTDNEGLFDFTLEEIECMGYNICEMSRDLHTSDHRAAQFKTEYETKFIEKGKSINYLKVLK